jgi:hypothetical protein
MYIDKPCECNFCNQFYFARSRNYQYLKNKNQIYKKKLDENDLFILEKNNAINNDGIDIKIDLEKDQKKFTLNDLDVVSILDSQNYNLDEISKTTNLSESLVKYILSTFNYWK